MITGNTRGLCQNCGSTYTRGSTYKPSDEFCGNCGQRLTDVNGNTVPIPGSTPLPPPPPTQPSFRPLTPTYPVTAKPPFWTRGKIIVLTATILLLLLFLGAGLFSLAYQLGRNSTPISPIATTASGTTATTASGTTATTVPTASGTTPTTTPTLITITKNLDIPCINSGCYKIDLKLTTIVIDTTKQESTWNFTLTNNDNPLSSWFTTLILEDNTGQKHQGGGPASTGRWNMSNGQSIPTYATFDVIHGTNYSLTITLNNGANIYQTEIITF